MCFRCLCSSYHFFSTDPAPPEISTLSLHDALPISTWRQFSVTAHAGSHRSLSTCCCRVVARCAWLSRDRKSTRLNSSHVAISYAVFCLKKKKRRKRANHTKQPGTAHLYASSHRHFD